MQFRYKQSLVVREGRVGSWLSHAIHAVRGRSGEPHSLERGLSVALFGCATVYATLAARFFARMNAPLHFDDGYVAAVATRLIQHRFLPYVDAASNRGVGFYWLASVAQKLGGWNQWVGMRVLASGCFIFTVLTLFAAASAARRALAGAVAALLMTYVTLCVFETETVFGMVSEPFASEFSLLALLTATLGLTGARPFRGRCALLAASGVLSACAGVTKQTYLPAIGPFVLWASSFALSEPGWSRERRVWLVLALLGGWVLPLVAIVLTYAVAGELSKFTYWFVTYNREIYMGPYGRGSFRRETMKWVMSHGPKTAVLVLVILGGVVRVAVPVARAGRHGVAAYRRLGFEATCTWQAVLAVIGTVMPLRFWSQYELPPAPWLALLVGLGLDHWSQRESAGERRSVQRAYGTVVMGVLLLGVTAPLMSNRLTTWKQQRKQGSYRNARPDVLCESVDKYARRDEPIFIWGFDATDVYTTCQHPPASRYVYMTTVAGLVPPFWDKPNSRYVPPHAREDVMADLKRTRPPVILDYPGRMGKRDVHSLASLHRLLERDYCALGKKGSKNGREFGLFVRKDRCPAEPSTTKRPCRGL